MSLERLWVIVEQCVNESEELHHSLILPQVLMTFKQEHKVLPITPCKWKAIITIVMNMKYPIIIFSHKYNVILITNHV